MYKKIKKQIIIHY